MTTSKVIKYNQKNPPRVLERRKNSWRVEGRGREHYANDRGRDSYWVTRSKDGKKFWCACQARGLCRHIQAVVKDLAFKEGYVFVQFWKSLSEAERQRRKTIMLSAKGRDDFWVNIPKQDPVVCAWSVPCPEIWEPVTVIEGEDWRIAAHNDGETWFYWFHKSGSPHYGGSVGQPFYRQTWTGVSGKDEFEQWFNERMVA